uniref:(northern house mosquito) hypothetical protein n=1 Tax=Culex pipiens TaxID=7175 RepID=A0A8D8BDP9_CULPI
MIGKLKHTATVIYRALGFVYALAGLVGCVLLLVFKNDLSADPEKRDVILKLACLGLFFFIVLILGLLLVSIYPAFACDQANWVNQKVLKIERAFGANFHYFYGTNQRYNRNAFDEALLFAGVMKINGAKKKSSQQAPNFFFY